MKYTGFLLVFISAASFGFMPVFASFAYKNHVSVPVLLLFRFLIAAVFLNIYVLAKGHKYPRGKTLVTLILMGGIGYATQSFLYFSALTFISASLTAILLYLYPSIVLVLSAFLLKTRIKKLEIAALVMATIGAVLVIGIKFEHINYIGIIFGVGAAFVYSIYIIVGAKAMKGIDSIVGTSIIVSSASFTYLLYNISTHASMPTAFNQWIWIFALAIVSGIMAIVTFFAGMKIVGPVKASMISTFEPVVTVYLSYLILDDTINIYQISGAVLIIAAALILAQEGKT
ncbi:MAG: DMT family transporter [Sulfurospirillaceae bacterium]|nr:DMT family transporter [Sulfurospirillaceae bacterium]